MHVSPSLGLRLFTWSLVPDAMFAVVLHLWYYTCEHHIMRRCSDWGCLRMISWRGRGLDDCGRWKCNNQLNVGDFGPRKWCAWAEIGAGDSGWWPQQLALKSLALGLLNSRRKAWRWCFGHFRPSPVDDEGWEINPSSARKVSIGNVMQFSGGYLAPDLSQFRSDLRQI